jgi:DUF971 family protein
MEHVITQIVLHKQSRVLEVEFASGERYDLPFEYLRVFSPSAEVRGHGGKTPPPVTDKQLVDIDKIEPVGNYAIKPFFNDGHSSGIFSWNTLYELGAHKHENWAAYLKRTNKK